MEPPKKTDQFGAGTPQKRKTTPAKPCGCGGPETCRRCAMLKAHEYRREGNEKEFEAWMRKAVQLMEIERK